MNEMDIKEILERSGAEAEGKPLNPLYQLVQDYGAGTFNIMQTVFLFAAGIGIIGGIIYIVINAGNAAKRGEQKDAMIWRIGAVIIGFGVVSLIVFLSTLGSSLFTIG